MKREPQVNFQVFKWVCISETFSILSLCLFLSLSLQSSSLNITLHFVKLIFHFYHLVFICCCLWFMAGFVT